MSSYFSLFPTTTYAGKTCLDITRRVTVRSSIQADPRAYRPYEVPAGQRADQIADGYYGTPEREWLVLMSADVVDPYYDWVMSDEDFVSHVVEKYGSVERALSIVHHWQLSWDGSPLSVEGWESLADPLKRYYRPVLTPSGRVLEYSVREDDLTLSTNMVVTVGVADADGFVVGEVVRTDGTSQVAWSNSTTLKLVSVQGSTDVGLTVTGDDSGASSVITSRDYTSNTIPIDERPFWEPVTCWDYESDKNESRKSVRLLDARYVVEIEAEMSGLLSR